MKIRLFLVLLLACGRMPSRAQSAEGQALAFDTVLAAASRCGEITQRLQYRETGTPGNPEHVTVVFVHHRQDGWYTKAFRVRPHQADSLVADPEQPVTN